MGITAVFPLRWKKTRIQGFAKNKIRGGSTAGYNLRNTGYKLSVGTKLGKFLGDCTHGYFENYMFCYLIGEKQDSVPY